MNRKIKYIVFHCTAGMPNQKTESILDFWKRKLGWKTVGYHKLVNADGTIAGCPNSAPEQAFGHINDAIPDLLTNPQRLENITCERSRDPRCFDCEVSQYCNSDCHQLEWQDDICGAPKSLMIALANVKTRKIINIKQI